ncbi:DUF4123 domain-containing protein [Sphingomonas sp.]|uniref:DUF4123 domain-containing protein n=1 Tax=Sphingomonas sp. TaxID=28214 RepID=UPI002DEEE21E|nr:DUF4123 domain-containing protein [Sphingomonas sp.]
MSLQRLYAVVDPAVEPRLYPLLKVMGEPDAQCLFAGDIPEGLREVSPHIFPLERGTEIMRRWVQHGIGQPWGVFLEAPGDLAEVRRHIRRFLQVRLPDGEGPVLFRIWDPRVLPVFLKASEADHLQQLYARCTAYIVPVATQLERLSWSGGAVQATPLTWNQLAAAAGALAQAA